MRNPRALGLALLAGLLAPACAKHAYEPEMDYYSADLDEDDGGYREQVVLAGAAASSSRSSVARGRGGGAPAPASAPSSSSMPAAPPPPPPPGEVISEEPAEEAGDAAEARLIHYNGYAQLRVTRPEEALASAVSATEAAGGYVERRSATQVVLRVPVAGFQSFFTEMLKLGDVLQKSITAEDVTDAYTAVDLRLKTATETRQRLQELLARAETDEEKLALLKQIQRLTEQIDVMEGQLRTLGSLAAFSRVTLDMVPRSAAANRPIRADVAGFTWIQALGPFRRDVAHQGRPLTLPVPEGFVALDTKARFIAESADGAVIWTTRLPNTPEGDTAFWVEAIRTRLSPSFEGGEVSALGAFQVIRFTEQGGEGEAAWRYLIGVQAVGKELWLVEVTWPSGAQEARYGAVLSAAIAGGQG